jgi:hypothetical protein
MLPKGCQQILAALALFGFLTAEQLTRLYYSAGSLTFVKALLKKLVASGLVFTIGGRGTGLPLIYTLTSKGRITSSAYLAQPHRTRVRPAEAKDKGENPYFMQHTLAVNDVLIGANCNAPQILDTRLSEVMMPKRRIEHGSSSQIYP